MTYIVKSNGMVEVGSSLEPLMLKLYERSDKDQITIFYKLAGTAYYTEVLHSGDSYLIVG